MEKLPHPVLEVCAEERQYRETKLAEFRSEYGHVIGAYRLFKIFGFESYAAFKQSLRRGALVMPLFTISGRRGQFAITEDVVDWLVTQWRLSRQGNAIPHPIDSSEEAKMDTG
jgi:hypothetical protein